MSKPARIGPLARSSSAELVSSRGAARAMPPDLLREASRRLGIMSLVAGVLWITGTVLGHLSERAMMPAGDPRWMDLGATDVIALLSVVVSLALFAYTRRGTGRPQFVLDLGLGYLVLMGLAIGLMFHWEPPPPHWEIQPELSWIGAILLTSAAIVPNAPWKVLVAGLVAVSMNPAGMLVARARGHADFITVGNSLLMHYPDYLLVGVAVVIAHVVTRLGHQVTKAREMGSYRLGNLLGRGGMGEVYQATHRMLARPAAIKLIRPEALGAAGDDAARLAVTRFHREAAAAANLRSPHTVEVYDFGESEDGTLYFVMELLDGMDLESLVRQYGPVPAPRVIAILRQVCESLEEAHAAGLVHRDVKPANIFVGRLGLRHDFVKVLDFGLVKPVAGPSEQQSVATAEGLTPGTPAYMAPEMALGETVDGRADVYALGCVAYYLLTGLLVFRADTGLQMIARHLQNEPVPPSQRTTLPVPPALERLVLACLAKSPNDRPDAAALGRALAAIDAEPWGEEQAARWWREPGRAPAAPKPVAPAAAPVSA